MSRQDATKTLGAGQGAQLALPVRLADDATFANFCPREELSALLAYLNQGLSDRLVFLHGPSESGKSHLLQAMCHRDSNSVYLPLSLVRSAPADDLLQNLEAHRIVAIDELEQVVGDSVWEESLFHLMNRIAASNCFLAIGSRLPPNALPVALADLRSRLAAALVWVLPACSQDEKTAILQFRAEALGLAMPPSVATYIVNRVGRSLEELLAVLDRLDLASLARQRQLTTPFVRDVLGWES
ncbi:MAG: DnaA regulatory inactivator Hda [Pseudomonadota bacterium]